MRLRALAPVALLLGMLPACGTIDPGDNIVAPNLMLDEDFFYCTIQPECLDTHSCAAGGAGEGGMCHTARSALRLVDTAGLGAPMCDATGRLVGAPPAAYMQNYEAVQIAVSSDPTSSPLYRRPTGMDSHPRVIFDTSSECAMRIEEWITRGGL